MSVRLARAEADLATSNVAEFCRAHGVSRDWFYELRRRFQADGLAGLELTSSAPKTVANRTTADVEDAIVAFRKELQRLKVDAGAATIAFHFAAWAPSDDAVPSEATIWRVLTRRGFITPEPSKRPTTTVRSFAAERANECWQIDDTAWGLADGTPFKIIDVIDDCTRVLVASVAVTSCSGGAAFDAMAAASEWGWPQRFLSDNASAFRHTLADALAELASPQATPGPTTPRPAARSSGFINPSTASTPTAESDHAPGSPSPSAPPGEPSRSAGGPEPHGRSVGTARSLNATRAGLPVGEARPRRAVQPGNSVSRPGTRSHPGGPG